MKRFFIIMLTLMISSVGFSQRILEWSFGEVEVICGDPITVSYPLMVSINNGNDDPVLGTSTIRFIYDAKYLLNLSIQDIQNGYSASGLTQSNPVLGEIFGFDNDEGVFVQFDLMDNANSDPLLLSATPTHVLNLNFDIDSEAKYPLCTPFVIDNNPDGWDSGIANDDGFVPGSAGIVGSYFLFQDFGNSISADDEVINLSWKKANGNNGKIKPGKRVGHLKREFCIKKNICKGPDCDDDGILDSQEVDTNRDGTPDDCEYGSLNLIGNYNWNALFKAYPIPFDQEVFIYYNFDYNTDVTIEIFDAKRTLVRKIENIEYYSGHAYQQRIDLSNMAHQMLFVKLTTNKSTSTKKIMSTLNQ